MDVERRHQHQHQHQHQLHGFSQSHSHRQAAEAPSIPTRTRFNSTTASSGAANAAASSRRRTGSAQPSSKRISIPPTANPEVISNLITSLSGIAKPADDYFEAKHGTSSASAVTPPAVSSRSQPVTPGSFGVDYGAFSKPKAGHLRRDPASLDEIAASAPTIRTSKPTSGYSPFAPPKSPRSPPSRENSSGGLRSFIRNSSNASRPSSNGSAVRNEDGHSIGNLSIEPGPPPAAHELQRRGSSDSWSRKASRTYKGLMYMGSRERLREKELEKKRSASSIRSPNRGDPFLAETAISEEPNTTITTDKMMESLREIPARDSSLRKKPIPSKSSRRSRRDVETPAPAEASAAAAATPQTPDYSNRKRGASKKVPAKLDLDKPTGKSFLLGPGEAAPVDPPIATPNTQRFLDTIRDDYLAFNGHATKQDQSEASAPFPSVSQNRRKSAQATHDRRRSDGQSAAADSQPKRSSSRLKRSSGTSATGADGAKASSEQRRDADAFGTNLERLDSADSIDDAVEAYLYSPRLSQKIRHPQTGRVICFSEVGDPEGSAVICCVGMGLTRYITAFYDELALTLKLRLITPDRPGVGESEPYPDGSTTPLNWPDDVYAICQALKITKFSIMAHSAGAIYALATALRMPQHIRGRMHLLAPWIPPSQMSVFGGTQASPPTNAIPTSQRILRALPTPMLKVANSSFMSATSTSITTSLPKNPRRSKRRSTGQNSATPTNRRPSVSIDQENLDVATADNKDVPAGMRAGAASGLSHRQSSQPLGDSRQSGDGATVLDTMTEQERQSTYDMRLTHAIWQLATTGANPAVDLLICLERRHTIGFRYVDINRPVIIHHGSRDTRVPVDNVRWLGKTMRRCEVRVLEGEGHGLMASATVMGAVLMEISKEWEDWMRATGADGRKDRERGRSRTIGR